MRPIKRQQVLPVSLVILIVSAASLFEAQEPRKPIKIDATLLQGIQNFRDIGGYKTADGHTIRYNMVYRSAMLHDITLADNAKLAPLKIRYEIDLRTDAERSMAPTQWGPNPPKVIDIPFLRGGGTVLPNNPDPAQVQEQMRRIYASYAVVNAPEIGEVLHDLAQGDEPALIHCTGGVDRTGMTIAVLMTLLGVSRNDVYREYLLSAKLTKDQMQHLVHNSGVHISPAFLKSFKIEASSLDAFFHAIDVRYGSFHAYVHNGLKLTSQDVQGLRRKLLSD